MKQPKVVLMSPPSPWLLSDREQSPDNLLSIASYLREKGLIYSFATLMDCQKNIGLSPMLIFMESHVQLRIILW